MLGRNAVLVSVALGLLFVACLDDGLSPVNPTDGPYLGQQSACSTGPVYADDTAFPAGPKESQQPQCIQRCGTHPTVAWSSGGLSPTFEAVPSGRCDYEEEACSMVAVKPCCGGGGTAYVFECRCKAGTWSCAAAYHGGGTCGPCTAEAGADDGGSDAGSDAN